ncbi:unnamed protein product [Rotaria sp. Silwood1]|nr:unnamed protein product [Rotaria sp. Silwood1]CAF3608524.1 unnamed protein product [Rotaria sp. Silwood1]CAF3635133.1 unnamed protein product [Rotaria sp. Silwood1]CAF4595665.1 unnamed protein product [Rotaria sp. Silwood1]CAF5034843.1 unnamed protein product [Rotaria sp. Silwood1]
MNQSSKRQYKQNQIEKSSTIFNDENNHSINNGITLSLQSFVDDIPFEFNQKYRTIIVPNINIPEYDTTKIRNILAKPIDFTLENNVLLEALEDLQRKKKEIQEDTLRQQSTSVTTNCQTTNSLSISPNTLSENIPFPVTLPSVPPLTHIPNSQPTLHIPIPTTSFPVAPVPPPRPPISPSLTTKPFIAPSYRLPSVRDIYWPTGNQQHYIAPISDPSTLTSTTLNLPTPIRSTNSSPNSVKPTNQSFNNCDSTAANDLTATFDETLGSDDPFHDAELKSLNDVAELRHLYSAIGSANTVRR